MVTLGPLAFAAPWMLLGLASLPILWWLLRVSPPSPKRVRFPAIQLLLGLSDEEETPAHTPLWLLLLRLALTALIVVALADPLWNPVSRAPGQGPMLIIVDDSWAAGPGWAKRDATMTALIETARRQNRPVAVTGTVATTDTSSLTFLSAADADAKRRALKPRPIAPNRGALLDRLQKEIGAAPEAPEVYWISDGLDHGDLDHGGSDHGDGALFAAGLADLAGSGGLHLIEPKKGDTALALLPPAAASGGPMTLVVRRADAQTTRTGQITAFSEEGQRLARAPFTFNPADLEADATIDLPLELRNRIARLSIDQERSAGATVLLDERWRRRAVGLITGRALEAAQPLLSDLYYLERALKPYAEIRTPRPAPAQTEQTDTGSQTSEIAGLLDQGISILILADVGQISDDDIELLAAWMDKGGVLVRFAGPRLAGQADPLVPTPLRGGGRALGGALSWTNPQSLSPFEASSPFYGLEIPPDVTVSRQVLAQPGPTVSDLSWARLKDGTPLVTATPKGAGHLVLFHITANTDWSNLPLSGLFVEMLRKIIALSSQVASPETPQTDAAPSLPPQKTLDGFGNLTTPPVTALPLPAQTAATAAPGPRHPPGLYGKPGSAQAFNLTRETTRLNRLPALSGLASRQTFAANPEYPLKPWLFALAFALLLIDTVAMLVLTGRLGGLATRLAPWMNAAPWRKTTVPVFVLALLAAFFFQEQARAAPGDPNSTQDDDFALAAALKTRLAYVLSGDNSTDDISKAGLTYLSNIIRRRTAAEPGNPVGVNIERDELAFFPLLYWPVDRNQKDLSPAAIGKINTYIKQGGTILFDTQDQDRAIGGAQTPAAETLQRLLANVDIPPLAPIDEEHVLTKSFYLLQTFPGRWYGGQLWVEAPTRSDDGQSAATSNDGVSSVIIGSNHFAGAWARDKNGRPLLPVVPGGERQRELASRFGVNLVMYALTGNYKADQVHVPALLERLGQ